MLLARLRTWFESLTRLQKAAILIWGPILLFVSVRVAMAPTIKTVYPIFSASGRLWWTAGELYEPHRPTDVQDGYRYSPTFAILVTPFAVFPDAVGGVLWRWFNMAALFGALAWLARSMGPDGKNVAGLAILIVPLSLQSLNNGQANPIVIAAMVGMIAAVRQERWNLAAMLMAVAFIIKVYPLALGMVLILLYPRALSWRIAAWIAAGLLMPYLCQHPTYVNDQYGKWIAHVRADDRADTVLENMYRDLWLLIHLYGLPISRQAYMVIQASGGILVAIVCWHRHRVGWPVGKSLIGTLSLVSAWIMLLGPTTESSSFILLAPALAWSILEALDSPNRGWRTLLLWGSCLCIVVAVSVGVFTRTVRVHGVGVHSWASLLYFAYLLFEPRPKVAEAESAQLDQRLAA